MRWPRLPIMKPNTIAISGQCIHELRPAVEKSMIAPNLAEWKYRLNSQLKSYSR